MSKNKTAIRYSLRWAKSFCNEIAKGKTVKSVIEEWREKGNAPAYSTFWLWETKYTELHDLLTAAFESCVMLWHDELQTLSLEKTPQFGSPAEYTAYREDKRTRIDVLKFSIAKIAPVLSSKYAKSSNLNVSGVDSAPQIVITSYATPETKGKKK